jgi:mRNA-degrading endonuclease YafQ of YafQ-DinJ toxin-antitoxin module
LVFGPWKPGGAMQAQFQNPMKILTKGPFKRDFQKLPDVIKRRTEAALRLLLSNPHHPSLRIKKVKSKVIKGYSNVFEGRITRDYRFFFLIEKDAYTLLRCGRHEEFLK